MTNWLLLLTNPLMIHYTKELYLVLLTCLPKSWLWVDPIYDQGRSNMNTRAREPLYTIIIINNYY